jgi:hypothetical protein
MEERTREAGPPRHPSRVAREKSRDDYIALQAVFPSFTSHSTLAPTFQPSPLTWCSLPSSIFTVAMPLSSILVTVPVIPPASARLVTRQNTATLRPTYYPRVRIICMSSSENRLRCRLGGHHREGESRCQVFFLHGVSLRGSHGRSDATLSKWGIFNFAEWPKGATRLPNSNHEILYAIPHISHEFSHENENCVRLVG